MKKPNFLAYNTKVAIAVHAFLIIVCLFVVLPMLFMLIKASQNAGDAISPSIIPGKEFLNNLKKSWFGYSYGQYMINTLIITTSITIGKTLLSILAALVLVYFYIPKKAFIFWGILLTLYIPTDMIAIGLFDLVSQDNPSVLEFLKWIINPVNVFFRPVPFGFDWANTYPSVIVPFLASATGTFLFVQHFRSIPKSFAEVALMEGISPLGYLFKILIPISVNTIGALWVIQFISFWNQYFWPRIIIRDDSIQVIQVALRSSIGVDQVEWGIVMAGAIISIIPPLIVFILLLKQLKTGTTLSTGK